jgi:hypothetical protein
MDLPVSTYRRIITAWSIASNSAFFRDPEPLDQPGLTWHFPRTRCPRPRNFALPHPRPGQYSLPTGHSLPTALCGTGILPLYSTGEVPPSVLTLDQLNKSSLHLVWDRLPAIIHLLPVVGQSSGLWTPAPGDGRPAELFARRAVAAFNGTVLADGFFTSSARRRVVLHAVLPVRCGCSCSSRCVLSQPKSYAISALRGRSPLAMQKTLFFKTNPNSRLTRAVQRLYGHFQQRPAGWRMRLAEGKSAGLTLDGAIVRGCPRMGEFRRPGLSRRSRGCRFGCCRFSC